MAPTDKDTVCINGYRFKDVTNVTSTSPYVYSYRQAVELTRMWKGEIPTRPVSYSSVD